MDTEFAIATEVFYFEPADWPHRPALRRQRRWPAVRRAPELEAVVALSPPICSPAAAIGRA